MLLLAKRPAPDSLGIAWGDNGVRTPSPRFLACGDSAVTVEFGREISPALNALALGLDAALRDSPIPGIIETVPTYRSLLVQFDPLTTSPEEIEAPIRALLATLESRAATPRRWKVPVIYGGAYGIDLEDVAARHGISVNEVVRRHSEAVYTVAMLGFLPGFCYLAGLDPSIATPRRTDPRAVTPAGSIAIGGIQANIASLEAPSGWHLLGRTPMRPFMPGRDRVFLIDAGDEVVFEPLPAERWDALDKAAAAGEWVAQEVSGG
jgi:KipI family sensor histidine kinase inhibitor